MRKTILPVISLILIVATLGAASKEAAQAPADLDGIKSALDLIPNGVLPTVPQSWTVAKQDVANDVFTHQVLHKRIRLQVKVVDVVRRDGNDGGYIVKCLGAGRDETDYGLIVSIAFPPEQCLEAARVNCGDQMFVQGSVDSNLFDVEGQPGSYTCQLQLALSQVTMEPAKNDAAK